MARTQRKNQEWVRAHQGLLSEIRRQVAKSIGPTPDEIRRLERAYRKTLGQRYRPSQKLELVRAVQSSPVVIGGDFHADPQSQRTHLRILREIDAEIPVVLGIEMFEARHQSLIELFLRGRISEKKFLAQTRWQERWGFSWEQYRPLFELVRKNRWRVLALNPNKWTNSISVRDRFAARLIAKVLQTGPALVYVIIGDLHLAPGQLPLEVQRETGVAPQVVHLNSESVFLDLVSQGRELTTEVVRFTDGSFCVQNSPPWMRWIQYMIHLEQWVESEDLHHDHVCRLMDLIFRIASQELGGKINRKSHEVYVDQGSLIRDFPHLKKGRIHAGYIPEVETFLVPQLSVNKLAGYVGAYWVFKLSGVDEAPSESAEHFYRKVWIEMWSAFVSRLINPSRPAVALSDLQAQARQSQRVQDVLKLCLSFLQQEIRVTVQRKSLSLPEYEPRHKSSYRLAAEVLGGQLGQRLFWGYRRGLFSRKLLSRWMGTDFARSGFESRFGEIMIRLSRLEVVTKTKRERL